MAEGHPALVHEAAKGGGCGWGGETLGENHDTKRPPPPRPPLGGARAGRPPWATVGRDVPYPRIRETAPQIEIVSSPATDVGRGVKAKSTHSLTSPFNPRHQDDSLLSGGTVSSYRSPPSIEWSSPSSSRRTTLPTPIRLPVAHWRATSRGGARAGRARELLYKYWAASPAASFAPRLQPAES